MASNNTLLQLANEQKNIFKTLLTKLYDTSLAGLKATRDAVNDLQERHQWYHIQVILDQIANQKERAKEILINALDQLESTVNAGDIRKYLNELISAIDLTIGSTSHDVLLFSTFMGFGLFTLLATGFGRAGVVGILSVGMQFLIRGVPSEPMFWEKANEFDEKLTNYIINVENQKSEQLEKLDEYFNNFAQKLRHWDMRGQISKINIVWYDKNIRSNENQSHIEMLKAEFPAEQYNIMQFDKKKQLIDSILSSITNNLVLITSGSAGKEVISEIGHYFHIKGIIIYCGAENHHRTWASQYKKVVLVTNEFFKVIQKIQDIEKGQIYFVNYGFSFDDITIKLKQTDYYLSTSATGFICSDFSTINSSIDYHNETMKQLRNALKKKDLYPKGLPSHFQLDNLFKCAQQFVEALKTPKPESSIIRLYTVGMPSYYRVINDILNLLDEELILIIQDYIKALRYSLIVYSDTSNKIPEANNLKLYRGISLTQNSFQEFSRKFKVHDTIIFPAFSSTTRDKDRTISFIKGKGVLLDISADCTLGNKPKSIATVSKFPGEDEVLLNCFSILTVKKITKIHDDLLCYECTLELR